MGGSELWTQGTKRRGERGEVSVPLRFDTAMVRSNRVALACTSLSITLRIMQNHKLQEELLLESVTAIQRVLSKDILLT